MWTMLDVLHVIGLMFETWLNKQPNETQRSILKIAGRSLRWSKKERSFILG